MTQAVCVYLPIITIPYGIKLYFLRHTNILNQKQEPNFINIMKWHKKPVYHTNSVNLMFTLHNSTFPPGK